MHPRIAARACIVEKAFPAASLAAQSEVFVFIFSAPGFCSASSFVATGAELPAVPSAPRSRSDGRLERADAPTMAVWCRVSMSAPSRCQLLLFTRDQAVDAYSVSVA